MAKRAFATYETALSQKCFVYLLQIPNKAPTFQISRFCCLPAAPGPLPLPIAEVTRKEQPSPSAYHIPPLNLPFYPNLRSSGCADPCLSQESACLGTVTNLLPSQHNETLFKDINIHTLPIKYFVMTLAHIFSTKINIFSNS